MRLVEMSCANCGKRFMADAWRAENKNPKYRRRYCGRDCSLGHCTKKDDMQRFWSKVDKRGPKECWMWTGAKRGFIGYGNFWLNRKNVDAHRFSFERVGGGKVPSGHHVLHRCDKPSCVNPAHLFTGTHEENMADMKAKGRTGNKWKSVNQNFHVELFRRLKAGEKQVSICRALGVSARVVIRYAALLKLMEAA